MSTIDLYIGRRWYETMVVMQEANTV